MRYYRYIASLFIVILLELNVFSLPCIIMYFKWLGLSDGCQCAKLFTWRLSLISSQTSNIWPQYSICWYYNNLLVPIPDKYCMSHLLFWWCIPTLSTYTCKLSPFSVKVFASWRQHPDCRVTSCYQWDCSFSGTLEVMCTCSGVSCLMCKGLYEVGFRRWEPLSVFGLRGRNPLFTKSVWQNRC